MRVIFDSNVFKDQMFSMTENVFAKWIIDNDLFVAIWIEVRLRTYSL